MRITSVLSIVFVGSVTATRTPTSTCDPEMESIYSSVVESESYVSTARRQVSESRLLSYLSHFFVVPEDVVAALTQSDRPNIVESKEDLPETSTSANAETEDTTTHTSPELISVVGDGSSTMVEDHKDSEESSAGVLTKDSFPPLIASGPLVSIGKRLGIVLDKLIENYVLADSPIEMVNIPLYLAHIEAEYQGKDLTDQGSLEFINLLNQVHFMSVVAHSVNSPEEYKRFGVVAQFAIEKLMKAAFNADPTTKLKTAAGDVRVGQVVIPGEVVDEAVQVGWCCLLNCLQYMRGTTTTTTTSTPAPTVDPAVAAKRRAELTKYLQLVNQKIDSLNQLIGQLKVTHSADPDSEEFKAALATLRSATMECYSSIMATSLMNESLVLDLSETKKQILAMADMIGRSSDSSAYESIMAELPQIAETLRSSLLEAAKS